MKSVYLDNGATSWPKPQAVIDAMVYTLTECGGSPGRSGHELAARAAAQVRDCRETIARFFSSPDPDRVLFSASCTMSINMCVLGCLGTGDHVVSTKMEHNAIRRTLANAQDCLGIEVTLVDCPKDGILAPDDIERALTPKTKLVAMVHASNVIGGICPLQEIGPMLAERGVRLLVDAAQTVGSVDINCERDRIDFLCFGGHKGLMGPMGIGGVCVSPDVQVKPFLCGGTGVDSISLAQPCVFPIGFEPGTANVPGIAGLAAAVKYIEGIGREVIHEKERELTQRLTDALVAIDGVTVYGPLDADRRVSIIPFNVEGQKSAKAAERLSSEFGVMCRGGLQCAPGAHEILGTFPDGCLRFGIGWFNTPEEMDYAADAVAKIAARS
jgi:cysteine desulfurase/selenocysteine lyase